MIPPPPKKVDILPVAPVRPVVQQPKLEVPIRPAEPAYRPELPPMDWQPAPIIPTLIEAAKIFIRSGQPLSEPPQRAEVPPKPEAALTPVKGTEPAKINEKINESPSNDNFSLNFPVNRAIKKLPKKMQFKGKVGRQRTEAEVEELLTLVQARNGVWPNDNYVSQQMQRYYRREYPEYFHKGKKGKKVQAHRSKPIDISARRSGTNA